jgi:hypothetical protein
VSPATNQEFLPHARYIINHDIMSCTADGVVGNHLYSGRALGISEPWDIIQLHPELESQWPAIHAHYRRIGLSHAEHVIWNIDKHELGEHIGFQPSVFYFGPAECRYWGDQDWLSAVDYINSKNNFMALAHRLGIDTPATLCFDSARAVDAKALSGISYPCYLKAAVSVSGVGIYRCENVIELTRALARFDDDVPVQVQEEVLSECFLNLQYLIENGRLMRLVASEQLLDGCAHQGNRVPARFEPWPVVEPMAQWMKNHGMKGIFAFDVAVVQTESGLRFPAIECNPRFNGASYPTLIAQKLGVRQWVAMSLSTRHRKLADIDLEGIEFDPHSGDGVVIVNWGTINAGKLIVLVAGSQQRQRSLTVALDARL